MKAASIRAAALVALALTFAGPAPASGPLQPQEEALSTFIDRNLRSGGSWFTPAERAVIERKCGFAPGQRDGFEADLSDGSFICRGGRKVDDPEMRAVLRAAARSRATGSSFPEACVDVSSGVPKSCKQWR